ncbi:MAG TPA: RDD family protein [Pyrinomonadaceae bacterium]|nr:RDD family protein [Pyrinomonadaceae bacterium]
MKTYNAHETERMHQVHGAPLASFKARAVAFVIDFLVAFVLFAAVFILGARLASSLGLLKIETDVNLEFDLHHWYSILFVVLYFGLSTYLGNGKTPGKWLMGIRVVSLAHERMSLWHSFERALGYGASALEFGFGFIQYFIHPNRRTVHDRIAETIVVKEEKSNM